MTLVVDFQTERERRLLLAIEAHEPLRQMDKHLWQCNCGSIVFHVIDRNPGKIECAKCETMQVFEDASQV